jgi:uncharacterized membrane protein HdeD (DUF308 family)
MVSPFREISEPTFFARADLDTVRRMRGWFVGLGVAFVLLGVLAIFLPLAASLVTTEVIGWLLVIGGVLQGVHAFQNRQWSGSGWAIVGALIMVIAGVLDIAFPVAGTLALTLILASYFLVEGVLKIFRSVQHRHMRAWGWFLFDGLLCLLLGGLIWMGWPGTAVWALGLLVGINFIMGGSSLLLIALGSEPVTARS